MAEEGRFPDGTLALVQRFFSELNRRAIRYCHWKSTPTIATAMAGGTDLDLLVDRVDADQFMAVLHELGMKRFVSHVSRRYPAVEDYLGFDETSGRLVHLHIYYQLILGEHYVKNHRLPLEKAFLDTSVLHTGVRIPPPALELTVLTLRTLLKYRDTDALKDAMRLGHTGGIPAGPLMEIDDLRRRSDPDLMRATIQRNLPGFPPEIVLDFLGVVDRNPRDAVALVRLRGRARRALKAFERHPRWESRSRYLRARIAHSRALRPIFRGRTRRELRRKSPQTGGITIALVGPDGAGKTTVIEALTDWLAWRMNLRVLYLGSAHPSRATRVAKWFSKSVRSADTAIGRLARRRNGHSPLRPLVSLLVGIRYLGEATDRANRAAEGRRLAAQGAVVLFDRYPLPGVRIGRRSMDGARVAELGPGTARGLLSRLRRREEAVYRAIPPPDSLVKLRLPAAVALQRKASRAPEMVEAKSLALDEADLAAYGIRVVDVDATRPIEEVVRDVKRELWRQL
jgi:thymidylate kinase